MEVVIDDVTDQKQCGGKEGGQHQFHVLPELPVSDRPVTEYDQNGTGGIKQRIESRETGNKIGAVITASFELDQPDKKYKRQGTDQSDYAQRLWQTELFKKL